VHPHVTHQSINQDYVGSTINGSSIMIGKELKGVASLSKVWESLGAWKFINFCLQLRLSRAKRKLDNFGFPSKFRSMGVWVVLRFLF
jgi:hypothetical protein